MGIAATLVLIASNVVISLLRKFIPDKIRIAAYVVIIAGFVSVIEMLLKAYFAGFVGKPRYFYPADCSKLYHSCARGGVRVEEYGRTVRARRPWHGAGFTLALVIVSAIREVLGSGTIWGISVAGGIDPMTMLILPPGGFLALVL